MVDIRRLRVGERKIVHHLAVVATACLDRLRHTEVLIYPSLCSSERSMVRFPTVRSALNYIVTRVIPIEHGYIVNVKSNDSQVPRLQVVALGMIEGTRQNGLAVHLPFDIDSGQHENHLRFLELDLSVPVNQKDVDGIPCFYANFGTDYEYADRVILQLLVQLYQYSPSDQFTCEVYNQGPMANIHPRQAPPGGTVT